mmetsp:Transcript_11430/g.30587  ORF Transcript_11430/g.30587 Transcript_11430/m.30587 type:complete len:93 (+) Transcript_11430:128-406(+)
MPSSCAELTVNRRIARSNLHQMMLSKIAVASYSWDSCPSGSCCHTEQLPKILHMCATIWNEAAIGYFVRSSGVIKWMRFRTPRRHLTIETAQ